MLKEDIDNNFQWVFETSIKYIPKNKNYNIRVKTFKLSYETISTLILKNYNFFP